MEELQELNPQKETASNAMVTFMTLNTAGIQFIPATIIAVLAAAGSKNPTAIIPTTIIATLCGAIAAVTTAKLLQRFFPYDGVGAGPQAGTGPAEGPASTPHESPQ
jgi:spore maturation protein A